MTRLGRIGFNSVFRALQDGLLILCYHSVVPDNASNSSVFGNTVTESQFREQIQLLARSFAPISADDLRNCWMGTSSLPRHAVLVTFDDGYRDNLTLAAPILRFYGVPALFFVTTGYIGSRRLLWPYEVHQLVLHWNASSLPFPGGIEVVMPQAPALRRALASELREQCKLLLEDELKAYLDRLRSFGEAAPNGASECVLLDWDEVRELQRQGFDIGSHTVEHPILTNVSAQRLAHELRYSKASIEQQLGSPCRHLAYPNGAAADIDDHVVKATAEAGYEFAFTTSAGLCLPEQDPLKLRRVVIPTNPSRAEFEAHISLFHHRIKTWMARSA